MTAMKEVRLKLLVDVKGERVLFGEAGKDFVDFLFNLMTLPVGTVVRLLKNEGMVSSLGNLYESIENLSQVYMQQQYQDKEALLNPKTLSATNLTEIESTNDSKPESTNDSKPKYLYFCDMDDCDRKYVSDTPNTVCPDCGVEMSYQEQLVQTHKRDSKKPSSEGEGGYVKGTATFMIMDDLMVKPILSTISSITLLNQFDVKDVGSLQEEVIEFGMDESVQLLKTLLESKTVLTDIYFGKKMRHNSKRKCS